MRFLIPAALVFGLSCWFFSMQPILGFLPAYRKWFFIFMRAGELLGLCVLAHGLIVWAGADTKRWTWITNGCLLTGATLLIHALAAYQIMRMQLDSPLLQTYLTQWAQTPYIWRIALAVLVLLAGLVRAITKRDFLFLIVTVAVLALYRLAPELHLFLRPIKNLQP